MRVDEALVRFVVHASRSFLLWFRSLSDAKSELANSFAVMQ